MRVQKLTCRSCRKQDLVELQGPKPKKTLTYVCDRCAPGSKK